MTNFLRKKGLKKKSKKEESKGAGAKNTWKQQPQTERIQDEKFIAYEATERSTPAIVQGYISFKYYFNNLAKDFTSIRILCSHFLFSGQRFKITSR